MNQAAQHRQERQFTHPDDQTLVGPYQADHSPQRKEYAVRGTKRRTNGSVVVAVFKYRTNGQLLYLPTQRQAATLADIFASRLNDLHIVLKDGREISAPCVSASIDAESN